MLMGTNIHELIDMCINDQLRGNGYIGLVPEYKLFKDISNDKSFIALWFLKEHWQRTLSVPELSIIHDQLIAIGKELVKWLDERVGNVDKTE